MNCLEYFRQHYPDACLFDGTDDILAEMPIDSPCGMDCKMAIDAAVGLVNHVQRAYGDADTGHPKSHKFHESILNAAVEVCVCYIRG